MKTRITNVDTLSALFDRLITENIKLFFFKKDGLQDKLDHQVVVISEIKQRISELLQVCLKENDYNYISEKRTFNENAIIEELEDLIQNDINIGESDRARLVEVQSPNANVDKLVVNEKRLRKSNEGRSKNKNNIDSIFKEIVKR
tara:strand:- start:771 stop:1205 length:435 start_codon:yes stop_codon:yes gene_type:complete